ncbi:YhbY family RNA-binding protein [Nitrosovibrio sp. Nv17]|uniref:YhbY family RNA-binding protein n=1 Tax=Nitrosovibrio sp. Nv17 TaxID=1855339 RepID=UPI0009086750|nr:YhbY family RNA-binding protein [Nitrosovibrio sp. Nv17]SFW10755.1 putative RNA-binding protein, YhbY family [Nitrosovibrio sp. Nv17]
MLSLALDHRHTLRALAHAIRPIVWIGPDGLSENVLRELDLGLTSHELVKIRVFEEKREARNALLEEMCHRLGAAPVQHIGRILIIYRPKPDGAPQPVAPATRRKHEPRRSKRSFQG